MTENIDTNIQKELIFNSNFLVLIFDSNLKVIERNTAFKKISENKDELVQIFEKEFIDKVNELVKKNKIEELRECRAQINGKDVWLRLCGKKGLNKKQFILYGADMTPCMQKEIRLEEQVADLADTKRAILNLLEDMGETQNSLRAANQQLMHLDEMKNEFISIASHELRTPMTSIKGYISMILNGDAGELTDETQEFLEEAYRSNEQMIKLVNDMLDVSRIERGQLEFEFQDVDASKVISEAYTRMKPMADDDKDTMIFEDNLPKDTKVLVDSSRLQQVIQNLLENAIKFTEEGEIKLMANKIDNMVEIRVKDNGIGISKEDQKKLFQKFYQVRSGLSRPKGGTGLGLYITKNIIEGMGGNIWMESEEGKGATFIFTVPLSE